MDKIKLLKILISLAFVITLLCYPLLYPVQPVTGISPTYSHWEVLWDTLAFVPYAFLVYFLVGMLWALFFAKEDEQVDSL